jgi:hypothetical protein
MPQGVDFTENLKALLSHFFHAVLQAPFPFTGTALS